MQPLSATEVVVVKALVGALCTMGAAAVAVELAKVVQRQIRYRRVLAELARSDRYVAVSPLASARSAARDRAGLAGPPVHALRPAESRDVAAAKVLAFRERLAARGRYVSELEIERVDRDSA